MKDLLIEAYERMYAAAPVAPAPVKPAPTPVSPPAPKRSPNPFGPRPGRRNKPVPKPKAKTRQLNTRLRGICDAAVAMIGDA